MNEKQEGGIFAEILQSETAIVRCNNCGTDQPVNKVYLPYLTDGISSCRNCRGAGR